ncbi:MAG: thiamine pyrophosphate-binding protein [Eggerthellaceae bacterium]|nr:thiamine pyrophosphate-binding protein [Eggerthellaceae bacterium]
MSDGIGGKAVDAGGEVAGAGSEAASAQPAHEQTTALWVAAFFDELVRWGVHDVVVSLGSRSTALAMAAFELSQRRPRDLRLYVDVDERGAAFLALGTAKASGRPAVLVCTSGTALANYYPAVIEAETSRVPLIVLSGDRPPRMQGLGAPQTTDQLKAYGEHVRAFRAMPLPSAASRDLAFARQAAREACLAALGGGVAGGGRSGCAGLSEAAAGDACGATAAPCGVGSAGDGDVQVASRGCERMAGPVHLNFPFDEPLKPDFAGADALVEGDAFAAARRGSAAGIVTGSTVFDADAMSSLRSLLRDRRTLVLAGEGTCSTLAEAREVAAWAHTLQLPLLADPLSGLRSVDAPEVIDNYDNVCRQPDCPAPDLVIRFGRYPVSKHATLMAAKVPLHVVVDAAETRDFNSTTDVFVAATPLDFVRGTRALGEAAVCGEAEAVGFDGAGTAHAGATNDAPSDSSSAAQRAFLAEWTARNDAARARIDAVAAEGSACADALEGAYVRALLDAAPANSCVFSANSMAVRALDTFYTRSKKPLAVLCNRGQNGIDGTVSTAVGAAQHFAQTTFVTGDFTLLHDLNALALQRELLVHHGGENASSLVIVLLNNNGGAIFDMLPQASDDPYFERLFLVPQDVRFEDAARAFGVPYRRANSVVEFTRAYRGLLGTPGISLVEVQLPLRGVRERYGKYQG